jgi:hypothetical protein
MDAANPHGRVLGEPLIVIAKAFLYITAVAAILAFPMPIAHKRASAVCTGNLYGCLVANLVAVAVPPQNAALVSAKSPPFAVFLLHEQLAAVSATMLFRFFSAAMGFYRVDRQPKLSADLQVGQALLTHGNNLCFFLISHICSFLSFGWLYFGSEACGV